MFLFCLYGKQSFIRIYFSYSYFSYLLFTHIIRKNWSSQQINSSMEMIGTTSIQSQLAAFHEFKVILHWWDKAVQLNKYTIINYKCTNWKHSTLHTPDRCISAININRNEAISLTNTQNTVGPLSIWGLITNWHQNWSNEPRTRITTALGNNCLCLVRSVLACTYPYICTISKITLVLFYSYLLFQRDNLWWCCWICWISQQNQLKRNLICEIL